MDPQEPRIFRAADTVFPPVFRHPPPVPTTNMEHFRPSDCWLYLRLTLYMNISPGSSLLIIALWKWLEEVHNNPPIQVVYHLLTSDAAQLIPIVTEAQDVLDFLGFHGFFPSHRFPQNPPYTMAPLPAIRNRLHQFNISLQYLHQVGVRQHAANRINGFTNRVFQLFDLRYYWHMNRFMRQLKQRLYNLAREDINGGRLTLNRGNIILDEVVADESERTLFITFMDGNPCSEEDLRECFGRFGELDRVTRLHFNANGEARFAIVVFKLGFELAIMHSVGFSDQVEMQLRNGTRFIAGPFYVVHPNLLF